MVGLLLTSSVGNLVSQAASSSLTNDSIKKKEEQISQAEKEKKELKNVVSDVKAIKKELEQKKADLKEYIQALDEKVTEMEDHIDELISQIAKKEGEIEVNQQALEVAKDKEAEQLDAVLTHIKVMYEQKDSYIAELLYASVGLSDMLNKASYMEQVADYDQGQWHQLIENREYVELCETELELQKDYLDEAKGAVEYEKQNLEELILEKETDVKTYETDIRAQEQAIKEYEDEIAATDEVIKQLEKAIEEEKKKLLEAQKLRYDGGMFCQPLATYTRISSNFGNRFHPILKVNKMHYGVDFAAAKGTDIYAAYNGKVVAATYHYSMGNYVMIDHGDNLYTIYMHASKLCVKEGETVVKGQKIAEVGTTGSSTGYHLHFGVRLNGVYVSPWDYLKQ